MPNITLNNLQGKKTQTLAQWAVDATIYPYGWILIASDEPVSIAGIFQFKISNGTNPWSSTAYYLTTDILDAIYSASTPSSANPFATIGDLQSVKSNDVLVREALGSTILASSFDISRTTQALAMADGRVYFVSCYLRTDQTITGVKWIQDVQGNYTADNYNGVGLYTYSGGTLTLVASSTNDGNIWKGASGTVQSKAFSGTYPAASGLYFIGMLYNQSAVVTNPAIEAMATLRGGEVATFDFTDSGKLFAFLSTQASLPTPQLSSGLTVHTVPIFAALY